MNAHQLQGTDGVFESTRGEPCDHDRIWLRSLSKEIRWHDLAELMATDSLAEKFLPEMWRNPPEEALKAGHGGSDYFGVEDFMKAITGRAPCPIGIHEAMDMTLPGLVSQDSARQGGAWLDVPDSRQWTGDKKLPQLQMAWPADRLKNPPQVRLPQGYVLRQLRLPEDRSAYLALLHKAGFTQWDDAQLAKTLQIALPGGYFVVEHTATGALVATAVAQHHGTDQHPFGAELGWVAADPEHKGKGLGWAVTAAATARMLAGGYTDVYLRTDDTRLPALKVYLDMGYRPLVFVEGMAQRWEAVRKALGLAE
jgi:mycothiol synthase